MYEESNTDAHDDTGPDREGEPGVVAKDEEDEVPGGEHGKQSGCKGRFPRSAVSARQVLPPSLHHGPRVESRNGDRGEGQYEP